MMISLRPVSLLAAMALLAGPSLSEATETLCSSAGDGRAQMNKEVLASRLLEKFPISVTAIDPSWLSKLDQARPNAWILANTAHLCGGAAKCSAADKASLDSINGELGLILSGKVSGIAPSASPPDISAFFASPDQNYRMSCTDIVAEQDKVIGQAQPQVKSSASLLDNVRVRANPNQLGVARSGPTFTGDAPATLSVLRDGVAKTSTYKVSGTVGYVIYDSAPSDDLLGNKVIGYVNTNYTDVSAFKAVSKPPTSDTVDIGLFASSLVFGSDSAIAISLRPDYLWDFNNDSQLFTLNARAVPRLLTGEYLPFPINSYASIPGIKISYEPTIDLRLDAGRYTHADLSVITLHNASFVRLGTQVGVNFVSDNDNIPLTFNANYTYLDALVGLKDINYLSTVLTYSFDKKKYVGISLSYNNGTLEDTAKRQEQTTVSLSVKY